MDHAAIVGLITSTTLTLVVIPVAHTYLDDVGTWGKRRFISEQREIKITAEQQTSGLRHTMPREHSVTGTAPPPTPWRGTRTGGPGSTAAKDAAPYFTPLCPSSPCT